MNILFLGEYNFENLNFVDCFENKGHIISKAFWTDNISNKKDCFEASVNSEDFKQVLLNVLFTLSFEPDVIVVLCENLHDAWGISSLKRYGNVSSKCFSVLNNVANSIDMMDIAIVDTFEKIFVFQSDNYEKFLMVLEQLKGNKEMHDFVEKTISSFLCVKKDDIVEKILEEIRYNRQKIECTELM